MSRKEALRNLDNKGCPAKINRMVNLFIPYDLNTSVDCSDLKLWKLSSRLSKKS